MKIIDFFKSHRQEYWFNEIEKGTSDFNEVSALTHYIILRAEIFTVIWARVLSCCSLTGTGLSPFCPFRTGVLS